VLFICTKRQNSFISFVKCRTIICEKKLDKTGFNYCFNRRLLLLGVEHCFDSGFVFWSAKLNLVRGFYNAWNVRIRTDCWCKTGRTSFPLKKKKKWKGEKTCFTVPYSKNKTSVAYLSFCVSYKEVRYCRVSPTLFSLKAGLLMKLNSRTRKWLSSTRADEPKTMKNDFVCLLKRFVVVVS